MVVPAREPVSYEVNQSVVLRWGRREGKRRLGAAWGSTTNDTSSMAWHRPGVLPKAAAGRREVGSARLTRARSTGPSYLRGMRGGGRGAFDQPPDSLRWRRTGRDRRSSGCIDTRSPGH